MSLLKEISAWAFNLKTEQTTDYQIHMNAKSWIDVMNEMSPAVDIGTERISMDHSAYGSMYGAIVIIAKNLPDGKFAIRRHPDIFESPVTTYDTIEEYETEEVIEA